jgi:hypothetical protein
VGEWIEGTETGSAASRLSFAAWLNRFTRELGVDQRGDPAEEQATSKLVFDLSSAQWPSCWTSPKEP